MKVVTNVLILWQVAAVIVTQDESTDTLKKALYKIKFNTNKIQAHNLLQRQALLQPRRCNRPSLLPKRLKLTDVPTHLICHFSV